MKYCKFNFFYTLMLLFLTVLGFSQTKDGAEPEIYCEATDYQFEVESNFFRPDRSHRKSKVYVCPKNLPVEVWIKRIDNQPIVGNVKWKINGTISSFVGNPILLEKSDFDGDIVKLKCSFSDNGLQNFGIHVLKSISLKFSEKAKKYQFDNNKIQAYRDKYYPGTSMNVPWNFIESGNLDILKAKVSPSKGYYAANNIVTSLNIYPTSMPDAESEITLNYVGSTHQVFTVMGCGDEPELLVYTGAKKTYEIEFIEFCDTDDDNQIVPPGTQVVSSDVVCADGGTDLTFDEQLSPSFLHPNDDLDWDPFTGLYFIRAGLNKICDTKVHEKGLPECPSSYDVNGAMNALNAVYNKIGVDFNSMGISKIYHNYNLVKEDGFFDGKELSLAFHHREDAGTLADNVTEVLLVNYLDGSFNVGDDHTQGRAPLNSNLVSISVITSGPFNVPHEVGHAKFGLLHPGGPKLSTSEFHIDDLFNFMHGNSGDIKEYGVRRYQFKKIRNE